MVPGSLNSHEAENNKSCIQMQKQNHSYTTHVAKKDINLQFCTWNIWAPNDHGQQRKQQLCWNIWNTYYCQELFKYRPISNQLVGQDIGRFIIWCLTSDFVLPFFCDVFKVPIEKGVHQETVIVLPLSR